MSHKAATVSVRCQPPYCTPPRVHTHTFHNSLTTASCDACSETTIITNIARCAGALTAAATAASTKRGAKSTIPAATASQTTDPALAAQVCQLLAQPAVLDALQHTLERQPESAATNDSNDAAAAEDAVEWRLRGAAADADHHLAVVAPSLVVAHVARWVAVRVDSLKEYAANASTAGSPSAAAAAATTVSPRANTFAARLRSVALRAMGAALLASDSSHAQAMASARAIVCHSVMAPHVRRTAL